MRLFKTSALISLYILVISCQPISSASSLDSGTDEGFGTNSSSHGLHFPPPNFNVQWEPATGAAAGEYNYITAFSLSADYLSQALLQPWEEPIRPQTVRSQGGDLELWVSGIPEGSMVLVKLTAYGFRFAMNGWEGPFGYRYGRYYFLWNGVRRGFFEMRRPTPATGIASRTVLNDSSLESLSGNDLDAHYIFHDFVAPASFPNDRSYFLIIILTIINVAENDIDQRDSFSGTTIWANGAKITFDSLMPDPYQHQGRFSNRCWIYLLRHMAALPFRYDPPRDMLTMSTVAFQRPEGLTALGCCVISPS